jgi:DNA-binding transcriptional ArsR family regulator
LEISCSIHSENAAEEVAELFQDFSDTSRVRILSALAQKGFNVTQLALAVGISESGISRHMRGRHQMHLVQTRLDGKKFIIGLMMSTLLHYFNKV